MDYAVNRHYSHGVGRFISTDPVAASFASPQRLNQFAYADNDAINSVDPKGLWPSTIEDTLIGDTFDDPVQDLDLATDIFEAQNKGLKFCKEHLNALEDELQKGITQGELIRQRSAEVGGALGVDAWIFAWYRDSYFFRIPLGPDDQLYAPDLFYNLGYRWAAKTYNAYNRDYAIHHARIGRSKLTRLYETSYRKARQCRGYPALRKRFENLVQMAHFAEHTYLPFFHGILDPGV